MTEPATEPQQAADPAPEGDKTLTQSDVDRIVAERLQRERAKYADYNDLKKAAARLTELEQATLSETEKAVAKARAEAAREAEQATAQRYGALLVRRTVEARAAGRFHDPEDAYAPSVMDGLEVDADGNVDAEEVDRRLAALLERKPYLAKGERPRFGNVGQGSDGEQKPTDPRAADIFQIEQDIKASRRGA